MILQPGSNELSTHRSICKALLKPVPVARGELGRGGCSPAPQVPPSPLTARPALLPLGRAPQEQPCVPGTPWTGQSWLCPPRVPAHPTRQQFGFVSASATTCVPFVAAPGPFLAAAGHGRDPRPLVLARRAMGTVGAAGAAHRAPHAGAPRRSGLGGARCSSLSSAKQVWALHRLIWDSS